VNRREELLSVNKKWATDVLIKMLAYVYETEVFDNSFFDEKDLVIK